MGVYIKGMEMPTCGHTTIRIYADGTVEHEHTERKLGTAVPVPPHGRLIDADALIDAIIAKHIRHERNRELVFAVVEIKQDLADIINELPTFIEAEEGET